MTEKTTSIPLSGIPSSTTQNAENKATPTNEIDESRIRSRKFSLVSYCTREHIEAVLASRPVRGAEYILHDKDINPDGTPKPPHYHILVATNNAAELQAVRKWFRDPVGGQNTLGQVCRDCEAADRYLTHADDPDKAQYDRAEVLYFGEGAEPFRRAVEASGGGAATLEEMIDDINAGVSYRQLIRRYGHDYAIYRERYERLAYLVRAEERTSPCPHQDAWAEVVDLHTRGILSEFEFLRIRDIYADKNCRGAVGPIKGEIVTVDHNKTDLGEVFNG